MPAVRSGGQKGSCGAFLERGRVPEEVPGRQPAAGVEPYGVSRCGGLLLVCTLGGLEQGDGAAAPGPTVQWTVGQPAGESPGDAAVSRA